MVELADSFLIQGVDAFEGALADGFLVICEEEAPELRSLEEVFAVVLLLWHGQDLQPFRVRVVLRRLRLHGYLSDRHHFIEFAYVVISLFIALAFVECHPLGVQRPGGANV